MLCLGKSLRRRKRRAVWGGGGKCRLHHKFLAFCGEGRGDFLPSLGSFVVVVGVHISLCGRRLSKDKRKNFSVAKLPGNNK